ncbi:MAG TPA: hypothetical protein VIM69_11635 [Opitutaceae bacterium]
MLLLACFAPAVYQPIDRALKILQDATVKVFSWGILLLIFVLIFVPGRWFLRSRLRPFFRREKLNTYWRDGPLPSESDEFQRQF